MLNPVICAKCLQPNEPARARCWKCLRELKDPPTLEEYLNIFGLSEKWTLDDLKVAYRQLARKYHPDMNRDDNEADTYFKFVNQSYDLMLKVHAQLSSPKGQEKEKEKVKEKEQEADKAKSAADKKKKAAGDVDEMGSEELYQKLMYVIETTRAQGVKPVKKSAISRLRDWLNGQKK
jgi:hypothetical protein